MLHHGKMQCRRRGPSTSSVSGIFDMPLCDASCIDSSSYLWCDQQTLQLYRFDRMNSDALMEELLPESPSHSEARPNTMCAVPSTTWRCEPLPERARECRARHAMGYLHLEGGGVSVTREVCRTCSNGPPLMVTGGGAGMNFVPELNFGQDVPNRLRQFRAPKSVGKVTPHVTALCWLSDRSFAIGTSSGTIAIYDMRSSCAPISVVAFCHSSIRRLDAAHGWLGAMDTVGRLVVAPREAWADPEAQSSGRLGSVFAMPGEFDFALGATKYRDGSFPICVASDGAAILISSSYFDPASGEASDDSEGTKWFRQFESYLHMKGDAACEPWPLRCGFLLSDGQKGYGYLPYSWLEL
jgi:hypothetical protein